MDGFLKEMIMSYKQRLRINFEKKIFSYLCVSVCTHMHVCVAFRSTQKAEEWIEFPGAGFRGVCEQPNVGAGI